MTIGEKIEPVLIEIESLMIEYDFYARKPYSFSDDAFRAISKIFINGLLDKMWSLQESENIDFQDRLNMSEKAGNETRKLIKTFTGIDSHDFYKPKKI